MKIALFLFLAFMSERTCRVVAWTPKAVTYVWHDTEKVCGSYRVQDDKSVIVVTYNKDNSFDTTHVANVAEARTKIEIVCPIK